MKEVIVCVMIGGLYEGLSASSLSSTLPSPSDEPIDFADRKTGILMRNISLPSGVNRKINWILLEANV